MTEPESLGELARRFDRFEGAVNLNLRDERATREQQLQMVVKEHVYLAHRVADRDDVAKLDRRQDKLEDRLSWAWRTAITGVLLPLVVAVVYALLQLMGAR